MSGNLLFSTLNSSRFSLCHFIWGIYPAPRLYHKYSIRTAEFSLLTVQRCFVSFHFVSFHSASSAEETRLTAWADLIPDVSRWSRGRTHWTQSTHAYEKAEERPARGAAAGPERWRGVEDGKGLKTWMLSSFPHEDGRVCPFKHDINDVKWV